MEDRGKFSHKMEYVSLRVVSFCSDLTRLLSMTAIPRTVNRGKFSHKMEYVIAKNIEGRRERSGYERAPGAYKAVAMEISSKFMKYC